METELRILKLSSRAPAKNKPYNNISYLTYLQYIDLSRADSQKDLLIRSN